MPVIPWCLHCLNFHVTFFHLVGSEHERTATTLKADDCLLISKVPLKPPVQLHPDLNKLSTRWQ